jgi:hypothetical protein
MDKDLISNDGANLDFAQLLAALAATATTRRRLLQAGLGSAALSFFGLPGNGRADGPAGYWFYGDQHFERRYRARSRWLLRAAALRLG